MSATEAASLGRAKELETLRRALDPEAANQEPVRVINIWGESDAGKRALVDECLSRTVASGQPLIWLRNAGVNEKTSVPEFVRGLAESLQTNIPGAENRRPFLRQCIARVWESHPRTERERIRGSAHPAADSASFPGAVTETAQADNGTLAKVFAQGLLALYPQGPEASNLFVGRRPTLCLILDPFDSFSWTIQAWLMGDLLSQLHGLRDGLDCRFILVSEGPWTLPAGMARPQEKPFRMVDVPLQSEQHGEEDERAAVWRLLDGKTEQQKNWLLAAAVLPEGTVESLSLFGGAAIGQQGFHWLRELPEFSRRTLGGAEVLFLELRHQRALCAWAVENEREKFQEYRQRAEVFRLLQERVPGAEQRRCLARLAPCNYFNANLIERLYPQEAGELRLCLQRFPGYFRATPHSLTLHESLKPLIQAYADWSYPEEFHAVQETLIRTWEKKREQIVAEIQAVEKELTRHETERQTLLVQIQALNDQIQQYKNQTLVPFPSSGRAPPAPVPKRRRLVLPILLESGGVVCLYLGILSLRGASDAAITYICLGLYLIFLGMFMPASVKIGAGSASAVAVKVAEPAPSGVFDELGEYNRRIEAQIHRLRLQCVTLENKRKRLALQFAKTNQLLSEHYQRLNEPYI